MEQRKQVSQNGLDRPEIRWGLGCLLGGAAMTGLLILVFLIALALEPPAWVQVILALSLVGAGGALAVLIATALASRGDSAEEATGLRPAEESPTE